MVVIEGMTDRPLPADWEMPEEGTVAYRDMIVFDTLDQRRGLDYLGPLLGAQHQFSGILARGRGRGYKFRSPILWRPPGAPPATCAACGRKRH